MKKVIILDCGPSLEDVSQEFGQSPQWIMAVLKDTDCVFDWIKPYAGQNMESSSGDAWIITGSPRSVYEEEDWMIGLEKNIRDASKCKKPILGICFGHQIIAKEMNGKVKNSKYREFGLTVVKKINKSLLIKNFFNKYKLNYVWMSHADHVSKLPKGFKLIASSKNSKFTIVENEKRKFYGVQFHPEVTHTLKGKIILKNFIFSICKAKKNWSSKKQKIKIIQEVKNQVKNKKVICALSGGVDSSVGLLKLSQECP